MQLYNSICFGNKAAVEAIMSMSTVDYSDIAGNINTLDDEEVDEAVSIAATTVLNHII